MIGDKVTEFKAHLNSGVYKFVSYTFDDPDNDTIFVCFRMMEAKKALSKLNPISVLKQKCCKPKSK